MWLIFHSHSQINGTTVEGTVNTVNAVLNMLQFNERNTDLAILYFFFIIFS